MPKDITEQSRQNAFFHILKVVGKYLGKGAMYTTAAMGIIALFPGAHLPSALGILATGIGSGIISDMIGRVANGENLTEEEIRTQVEEALKKSQILEKDEFWHAFEHLRKGQRSLSEQNQAILVLLQRIAESDKSSSDLTIVDGSHEADGIGNITGLDIRGPVIIKPGTRSSARGIGNITGTRIGGKEDD